MERTPRLTRLMQRLTHIMPRAHWEAAWFALRINLYSLALLGLWTPLNTIVLPDEIGHLVRHSLQGTALGLITFTGIGIGAIVQPVAGRLNDRLAIPHRRKTFIGGGAAGGLAALILVGLAPTYLWLVVGYVLLQLASNTAQAAFQALIPDLVKPAERGMASGIKDGLGVLGAAIGLGGAGFLLHRAWGVQLAMLYLGLIVGVTAYLTLRWVPSADPPEDAARLSGLGDVQLGRMFHSFYDAFRQYPVFRTAVLARFLFFLGLYPVQRLFLYYLNHRFDIRGLGQISLYLLLAIVAAAIAAWAAGLVSDHVGRVPVQQVTVVLGALGVAGVAFSPWLWLVAVAGVCTAAGFGGFQAVNWAQLADVMPRGKSAQFYGLANIATAGSSALAGLFGPLSDAASALLPAGSYAVTFGLAALIGLSALLVLPRLSGREKSRAGRGPGQGHEQDGREIEVSRRSRRRGPGARSGG